MRITVGYGDPARGQVRKLLRESSDSESQPEQSESTRAVWMQGVLVAAVTRSRLTRSGRHHYPGQYPLAAVPSSRRWSSGRRLGCCP